MGSTSARVFWGCKATAANRASVITYIATVTQAMAGLSSMSTKSRRRRDAIRVDRIAGFRGFGRILYEGKSYLHELPPKRICAVVRAARFIASRNQGGGADRCVLFNYSRDAGV